MMYATYYIQYNVRIAKLSEHRKYIAKNTLKNIHSLHTSFILNVPDMLVNYFTKDLNKVEVS